MRLVEVRVIEGGIGDTYVPIQRKAQTDQIWMMSTFLISCPKGAYKKEVNLCVPVSAEGGLEVHKSKGVASKKNQLQEICRF